MTCRQDCNALHGRNASTCGADYFCTWSTKQDKCEKKCQNTANYDMCTNSGQAKCLWLGRLSRNAFATEFYTYDWVKDDQEGTLVSRITGGFSADLTITRDEQVPLDGPNISFMSVRFSGEYDKLHAANETVNRKTNDVLRQARSEGFLELKPTAEYRLSAGKLVANIVVVSLLLCLLIAMLFF
jgi:hypothetical protein